MPGMTTAPCMAALHVTEVCPQRLQQVINTFQPGLLHSLCFVVAAA